MEPQQSGVRTWQWVVTIIVIIVLIVIGIMVFGNKNPQPSMTDTNSQPTDNTAASNRLVVQDQYPGNVVYLSTVQVANPSWVVIQADNNGQPGEVLGSTHFDAGINPGKVTLTKPMIDGATYYAVIYTDDGSGSFSAAKDQPLKDQNGNVIMKVFHATSSAGAGLKG